MPAYQVPLGPQRFKVEQVNGAEHHDLLVEMQDICFGHDLRVDPAAGHWWIAYNQKHEGVGFLGLIPGQNYPGAAYLVRVGVIPGWRGRGLQVRMQRAMLRVAKRLGYHTVFTDTTQNPPSANSLIKCGFKTYVPVEPWGFATTTYWIRSV